MKISRYILLIILFVCFSHCTNKEESTRGQYVDPFIGTSGTGHTYPGATTPFGLVQLSPDMSIDRWEFCSGYNTMINSIIGFSHTHLNGTGVGDLGDILIMPTIGEITFRKGSESNPKQGYRSEINMQTEQASVGYYSVMLNKYNIQAELTASPRVGFHKYTFPKTDSLNLILDIASNISFHDIELGKLELINNKTIVGHKVVNSLPGKRNVYFALELSLPMREFILKENWKEKNIVRPTTKAIKVDKINLDGELDEKFWQLDNEINKLVSGNTENTGFFGTAWDETNLYFGFKVTDKSLISDSNLPWDDDGIEIYIDGNNDKSGAYDEFDRQIAIAFGHKSPVEAKGNQLEAIKKAKKTDDGYTMEVAIKWESLNNTPTGGKIMGIDFSMDDDDDQGSRESQKIWAGDDNNWLSTENFGELVLLNKNGDEPSKTTGSNKINDSEQFKINSYPHKVEFEKGVVSAITIDSKNDTELLVKVGLSTTSTDAALQAIEKEVPHWDFEKTRDEARQSWENSMGKIKVDAEEYIKTIFYTSLYHSMVQPNIISDIDGSFTDPDGSIQQGQNGKYYSTFSLWDTYRTWNPLMTLIDTNLVSEMVNSLMLSFDFYGHLPRWPLWGGETHTMIGNHAIPVIVDAYHKGIGGFNAEKAYEMVKASSLTPNKLSNWPVYNKYGYLPYDIEKTESVSKTLEMAFNDWCVAQMAKSLQKNNDYETFMNRANFYKNVFDSSTNFMRGKDSKGNWIPNFDPIEVTHANTGEGCYTEGNAWQHVWYVPQDIDGLISLMGGKEKFVQKLDSLFNMSSGITGDFPNDVTGLIGQYAHGNEPSHHVAYLYNYGGEAWKTQEMVREILAERYSTSRNGLCGNDDCGQMSAWYIMSAMGFYPVNPASGIYDIGSPCINHASFGVKNGKHFTINVENQSSENVYIKSIKLNGETLTQPYITHEEIMQGGNLEFVMNNTPNKSLFH